MAMGYPYMHFRFNRGGITRSDYGTNSGVREMLRVWDQERDERYTPVMETTFHRLICDVDASEISGMFADAVEFSWKHSPLPARFVRELGEAFAPRLTSLTLCNCGLRELPRQLGLLVDLRNLNASFNAIHWMDYRLARTLKALVYVDVRSNWPLPMRLQRTARQRPTRVRLMQELCALDGAFRHSIVIFMGVLRKHSRLPRDVRTLLGQGVWSLRFEVDHQAGKKGKNKKRM